MIPKCLLKNILLGLAVIIMQVPLLSTGSTLFAHDGSYSDKIYINSTDTISKYTQYGNGNNSGELYLRFSLPFVNSFCTMPEDERVVSASFLGVGIGLDYYHSKKQFIHLEYSGISAGILNRLLNSESIGSEYISFSNNHKIRRFSIGYGFTYAKNTWKYLYPTGWFSAGNGTESYYTLGLIFPINFQIEKYTNVEVVYRPTFYRPNMPDKFLYEHLISIDFTWKIRIRK